MIIVGSYGSITSRAIYGPEAQGGSGFQNPPKGVLDPLPGPTGVSSRSGIDTQAGFWPHLWHCCGRVVGGRVEKSRQVEAETECLPLSAPARN